MRSKMKRIFLILLSVVYMITSIAWGELLYVNAETAKQDNFIATIEKPDASAVKIYTADDLNAVRNDLRGSYVLMNDIDLSGYTNWEPIGKTSATAFTGKLDGQGYKITGLKISININSGSLNSPAHAAGLFGVCKGAVIKNLEISGANISIQNSSGYSYSSSINGRNIYAGAIAGCISEKSVIYNCILTGSVSASTTQEALNAYAGGIAGSAGSSIISYVDNNCAVSASAANAYSASNAYAGGLIGEFNGGGYIDHSFNKGNITSNTEDYGNSYAGGLIGTSNASAENLEITDGFNAGSVNAIAGNMFCDNAYAGGISGSFAGVIARVYVSGSVKAQASSYLGGNAYVGGISGSSSNTSIIQNSAVVQSNVSVSASGSGSKYQISQGGSKQNNIAVSSASNNDANIIKTVAEMKTSVPYEEVLIWDFENIWEIEEGQDFPKLKHIDMETDAFQTEYIEQHKAFIQGNEYSNILNKYRWAQIYWSQENNFTSNAAGILYNGLETGVKIVSLKFGDLFDDQNPYKIILADYIADQSVINKVYQMQKVKVPYSLDKIYKKAKKWIKEHWKNDAWGKLNDEDIFYLFHYEDRPSEEWVTSGFPEHLEEIVEETKNSGKGLETVLGVSSTMVDKLLKVKDRYNNTADFFNDLFNYSANVDAYIETGDEFKLVLEKMVENIPESDADRKLLMTLALNSYTTYNDSENEKIEMFGHFIEEAGTGKIKKVITETAKKKVNAWIEETFSSSAQGALKAIQWAAETGWKIAEYITKNGELQDCRNMLRANADFEAVMYNTLLEIEQEFEENPTIENARLFDAAYCFFEENQIYSIDVCMEYMDTYQNAWVPALRYGSNSFMNSAIEEAIYQKIFFYNTYCHGTSYKLGGKIIKVACPTDIVVYDANGEKAVEIVNNEVVSDADVICAVVIDDIKFIALPEDQEYEIEIEATDQGEMEYHITEYDAVNDCARTVVFEDIQLTKGQLLEGMIHSDVDNTVQSYQLMTSDEVVESSVYEINEDNYVEISGIVIDRTITEIEVGQEHIMGAKILPENASFKSVVWYSENENIAEVSTDGLLRGIAKGEAVITAYSIDEGIKDTVVINVKESEEPKPEDPKPEEPKPEDPKPEDPKPEEPKPENPKPEDPKPEEPKPEEPKLEDLKPEESEPLDIPFMDIQKNSWMYEGIKYVYDNEIMKGVGDGAAFAPNDSLTRAMFATVLYRMAGEPVVTSANKFPDVVNGKWYTDAVIWANEKGIVSGYGDGTFGPDKNITREQMAKMMMEYAKGQGYGTADRADLGTYPDKAQISSWANEYMSWAVGSGMIGGKNVDGKLSLVPKADASRAECATVLMRFAKKYAEE